MPKLPEFIGTVVAARVFVMHTRDGGLRVHLDICFLIFRPAGGGEFKQRTPFGASVVAYTPGV
jgi:hypothetical protein